MTNQEPASILLIDDHPMLRTGVKQLVSMAPDITVVGEASNGEQGIELAESLDPDLILLDLNMPGMNGLETLDKLREKSLSGRIVVFSVSNHEEDVVTALKRGPAQAIPYGPPAAAPPPPSVTGEAVAALLGLGIAEVNARRAVDQALIRLGDEAELPAVIRAALQELGR